MKRPRPNRTDTQITVPIPRRRGKSVPPMRKWMAARMDVPAHQAKGMHVLARTAEEAQKIAARKLGTKPDKIGVTLLSVIVN